MIMSSDAADDSTTLPAAATTINTNYSELKELPWKNYDLKLLEVLFKAVQTEGAHLVANKKTEQSKLAWLAVNDLFFDQPQLINLKHLKVVNAKHEYLNYRKLKEKFTTTLADIKKFIEGGNTR